MSTGIGETVGAIQLLEGAIKMYTDYDCSKAQMRPVDIHRRYLESCLATLKGFVSDADSLADDYIKIGPVRREPKDAASDFQLMQRFRQLCTELMNLFDADKKAHGGTFRRWVSIWPVSNYYH